VFICVKKRLTALLAVLLVVGLLGATMAGCRSGASGPVEVVVAQGIDLRGWDIHRHNNTATEAIHCNVFDYLVRRDQDMNIGPCLATSWDQVDETTWRFHLREGVKWHDGREFTAEDVKFTLERVASPDTGAELREHWFYRTIREVRVVDPHTVDIITDGPDPILLNRLCRLGSGMLPAHYIAEVGWEGFEEKPIGTGAYKFVEWIKDDRVVLEANPDYWGERAQVDRVVFRAIGDDSTRVAELLTGGVDIAADIPPQEWANVGESEGAELKPVGSQRVMLLVTRMGPGFKTSDQRVREAIDYAIDEGALVEHILSGAGTPCRTRVTPGNFGAHPDLYDTYLYDLDRARQLLAEAGYGPDNPCEITFHAPAGRYLMDKEIALAIGGMLEEAGFRVNLQILEWGAFSDLRKANKHGELYLIAYGNSLWDADLALNVMRPSYDDGHYGFVNDEYESLLDAAAAEMNAEKRAGMYRRCQEIVADGFGPQLYLFRLKNMYGVRKGLDFTPRADEMFIMSQVKGK